MDWTDYFYAVRLNGWMGPDLSSLSSPDCGPVTLGLYRNQSTGRVKGNQATFDNSQRNNLRSCVWVRW